LSIADRRSALVVVATEAEPVVAEWRLRYHRHSVERRIPPHLTVLFPFVAQPQVRDELLHELGRLYAPLPSFTYDLVSVEAFPQAAWLAPTPAQPFLDLIATTSAAFPAYPPYGDPGLAPVPHCTVGTDDDPGLVEEMVRELRAGLGPQLPIRCRAGEVTLLAERLDGAWATRATFPLGGSG